MQTIRIGHSPDADDAFMFYALTAGKVQMDGVRIEHVLEDIESLNRRARTGELEVTAKRSGRERMALAVRLAEICADVPFARSDRPPVTASRAALGGPCASWRCRRRPAIPCIGRRARGA